jgi:glutamine synthetase
MTTKEIIQYAKDHPSGKVKIALTDIDGILRGKYISAQKFLSVINSHSGFYGLAYRLS